MFPAATFARNVVHRGIWALFQFLLGLGTFSNGLSRYAGRAVTGRRWSTHGGSKALHGSAPIYYGCQYVASLAVTVSWRSSRFSRSNQGLRRISRSLKTLCGWNVDTAQLLRAFEHILPSNQLRKIFVANPTFRRSSNLLKLFSIAKLQYFLRNSRWRPIFFFYTYCNYVYALLKLICV